MTLRLEFLMKIPKLLADNSLDSLDRENSFILKKKKTKEDPPVHKEREGDDERRSISKFLSLFCALLQEECVRERLSGPLASPLSPAVRRWGGGWCDYDRGQFIRGWAWNCWRPPFRSPGIFYTLGSSFFLSFLARHFLGWFVWSVPLVPQTTSAQVPRVSGRIIYHLERERRFGRQKIKRRFTPPRFAYRNKEAAGSDRLKKFISHFLAHFCLYSSQSKIFHSHFTA